VAYGGSAKDSTNGPKHIIGILIRHKRDNEIGNPQSEETPGEDRFSRVQVGHSTPKEEEGSESHRVGGWLLVSC
jgi:hypothetical protein